MDHAKLARPPLRGLSLAFGGFPEPFVRKDRAFYRRWRQLRSKQLLQEDLRDLTRIQDVARMEILATVLMRQAGQLCSYTSFAKHLQISVDTARRWLSTLEALYYCFPVRPYSRNISRALRKEPKYYLWDWSLVEDAGARFENLVASHLLKSVHLWTDLGVGQCELYFIRDKGQREVDFLVTRDELPWLLVEAKSSSKAPLSEHLGYFQQQTNAPHALQVVRDAAYVGRSCVTTAGGPIRVPAVTFLSQLA